MTNNPICFVCGSSGAGCAINIKPQKKGAYFTFLTTHTPPDGANMPDSDGFVSACVVCKAFLTEQWNSYERHKTPLVERIFWMKRIDDQAFTGAEISIQGEFVAQYLGTNSNGLSIDEKLDHSSRDPNKLRRKPTGASFSGMINEPEESSSSCDDSSRVLDLSTSPRKDSPHKLLSKSSQGFTILPSAKSRHLASERKLRTRQNSVQNAATFVCYICRGMFSSPQKSRFLSCTYTSDDEPYFPFVRKLARPDGAKEITKSGLAEVCCDCRKTLSRQWRVFETRKVPVEKRIYDVDSLVHSAQLETNFHNNNNNNNINKNHNFLGAVTSSKTSFTKSEISPEELPRCFACLRRSNSLKSVSDLFLRGKSEHIISLLPLSKKLLERKSYNILNHPCCEKCSQIFFLESRVLEESAKTASMVSGGPRKVATEHSRAADSKNRAEEEFPRPAEEVEGHSPHLASDLSLSSSDSSRDCISPSKGNKARLSTTMLPSTFRVCSICQHDLDKGEISTASRKASVILYLVSLLPSSLEHDKFSNEIRICGKCSGYLLPSLLKDLKHLPLRKEFLNGGFDSSKCLICFYCSSKEKSNEPDFISVKIDSIREDMKSKKIKNLSSLGVREFVVCRRCHDIQDRSMTLKRKRSETSCEGSTKSRKVEHSTDDAKETPVGGQASCEETFKEFSIIEGVECVSTGQKKMAKVESNGDDDDDDEVLGNEGFLQDLNSRSCTSQNKNNNIDSHTSKCHRSIKTSFSSLHPPVSIFASSASNSLASASTMLPTPFHRRLPGSSPGPAPTATQVAAPFTSTYSPHIAADHIDPYYLTRYRAMNQLLTGRNSDGDREMKYSTLKQTTQPLAHNDSPRDDMRCSTGQNLCEVIPDATCLDRFTLIPKTSFYRPFSDDESLKKGVASHSNQHGPPQPGKHQFSREEQRLEASPPQLVSISSDFPAFSDERLTAALGLISLCCSKFPKGKPKGECDAKALLSTGEGEGCDISDQKNIPRSENESASERSPREGDAEASRTKTGNCNGIPDDVDVSDHAESKVIHWPGVKAIIESYNNYFRDLSAERKTLRSVRQDHLKKQGELISRGRNLQTTLKLLIQERRSLEESGRKLIEQTSKLKSCLKI